MDSGVTGVTALMVAVECLDVGLNTVSKSAMKTGMSNFVFIVYSNAFALVFLLLPSSLIFYRHRRVPHLTWSIVCRIFLLGLVSCCVQMFMFFGIGFSSPTLASAIIDLTPAFTYILAVISRMEKLDMSVQSCRAKSIGTMVSIVGALTVTLYKGVPIIRSSSSLHNDSLTEFLSSQQSNWVAGGILLAAGAFSLSLLIIVQTSIIKDYPEELMVTLICCIFVTLQSTTVSLIAEKNQNAWTLKPNMELIAIVYSAVSGVAIRSIVHTWACRKKGPVYVAMFKPLGVVIAAIMGISFLGDTLYLGSMIGGVIIVSGFYVVMWGKAKEESKIGSLKSCNENSPLLPNKIQDP